MQAPKSFPLRILRKVILDQHNVMDCTNNKLTPKYVYKLIIFKLLPQSCAPGKHELALPAWGY